MKEYLIDTHAHIDMLEAPIESTLQLMKDFGVKKAVIPSVEVSSMEKVIAAAEADENIYAMIGVYPSEAKTYTQEVEDRMIELAKNHKVKAVGEIGLDYYWDKSFVDLQKEVYVKQILLANKLNLPIVIHDREAHKDADDLLLEYNQSSKALFHCFSGSVEFMRECVKKGWYIALGGVVTFKNAVKMKDVAREIPLDKLVLETDSPYLTPVPFRGKPNTPAYVRYVAEEIANLRQIPLNELIDITTNNAERFFEI